MKNKARFVEIVRKYLSDLGWSDAELGRRVGVNRSTKDRWLDEYQRAMPQGDNLDRLIEVLRITDPADIHALYEAATGVPQLAGAARPDSSPPTTQPLTALHRQYLATLCGAMKRVNLANILETQRGAPELLDIYVPLPVDALIEVEILKSEVKDWRLSTGAPATIDAPDVDSRGFERDEMGRQLAVDRRPRSWPTLQLDEQQLAPLVQFVRGKVIAGELEPSYAFWRNQMKHPSVRWQVDAEQAASLQPRMVLIGDPGSGKSSFLRHLALCLAGERLRLAGDTTTAGKAGLAQLAGWLGPADLTPIYVELRSLVDCFPALPDGDLTPADLPTLANHFWPYLHQRVLETRLADFAQELETLCLDGKVILLLDGLDEVSQAETKERRQQLHHLILELTDTYAGMRIVIGSRPYAYDVGDWSLDGFGHARLISLPDDRLQRLARQLFGVLAGPGDAAAQADRFLDALKRADLDQSMVANPLYFTLWLALWHSTPAPHRLPATSRAGLYRAAVDLLLTRWFRRKASEIEEELGVPAERLRPVLETLACNLLADERRQDGNRFEFHIAELYAVLSDARVGHRREFSRLDMNRVDAFLAQHTGILALVSPRPNHYRFLHASFQEHLAACELTCADPERRLPPVEAARRFPHGLLRQVWAQPDSWWNATQLAADELLASGRAPALWSLLAEMCAPYLGRSECARAALLAMEIIARLPAGELPLEPLRPLIDAAQRLLVDLESLPNPAQRLIAGDALARLGDTRTGVGLRAGDNLPDIDWCKVPEMDPQGRSEFFYQEGKHPGLPDYWIARYPITYAQFQVFVDAPDGYRNSRWWQGLAEDRSQQGETRWQQEWQIANRPRENVRWVEAVAFCRWLTAQAAAHPDLLPAARLGDGWSIRLPTEWEWEKAARGWDDRLYPWGGQEYLVGAANVNETEQKKGPNNLQQTSAVGAYPQSASPCSVEEMSGNVWEFCLNEYENPSSFQESGGALRAMRGGAWFWDPSLASVSARFVDYIGVNHKFGFRVVLAASPYLGAKVSSPDGA